MADPVAQKFADQLPANVNHAAVAEKYVQLAPHSDKQSEAMCLAIEFHLRNLAAVAFMDADVRAALSIMERAQAQAKTRKAAARRRENAARRVAKKRGNK